MKIKILMFVLVPLLVQCAASVSSKKNKSNPTDNKEIKEPDPEQDPKVDSDELVLEDAEGPKVLDKNGSKVPLSKENGEFVLKISNGSVLPLQITEDLGDLSSSDSVRVFRIENATSGSIGAGSLNHESGNMEVCACEDSGLNIGPMAAGGCIKIRLSLKAVDNPPQKIVSSFLGIAEIDITGTVTSGAEEAKDLTIGGTCEL